MLRQWFLIVAIVLIVATLSAMSACGTTQRVLVPVTERIMPASVFRVPPGSVGRTVILTIDDGPSARTDAVLDILARHEVKATFFIHTDYITDAATRDAMARIEADGHDIAHHMPADRAYDKDTPAAFSEAFGESDAILREYDGAFQPYFRPPRGAYSTKLMDPVLNAHGYDAPMAAHGSSRRYIMASYIPWDAGKNKTDTDDPAHNIRLSKRYTNQLLANLYPGAIVIFHDGITPGREPRVEATLGALERFLVGVKQQGYSVIPLSEATSAAHP